MLYFVKPELKFRYAPSRLPVSVTQKEKSKGICMEGCQEKIAFLTIPPHSQLMHKHDAEAYAP